MTCFVFYAALWTMLGAPVLYFALGANGKREIEAARGLRKVAYTVAYNLFGYAYLVMLIALFASLFDPTCDLDLGSSGVNPWYGE